MLWIKRLYAGPFFIAVAFIELIPQLFLFLCYTSRFMMIYTFCGFETAIPLPEMRNGRKVFEKNEVAFVCISSFMELSHLEKPQEFVPASESEIPPTNIHPKLNRMSERNEKRPQAAVEPYKRIQNIFRCPGFSVVWLDANSNSHRLSPSSFVRFDHLSPRMSLPATFFVYQKSTDDEHIVRTHCITLFDENIQENM